MALSMSTSQAAKVADSAPADAPTESSELRAKCSRSAVIAPACHCTGVKHGVTD